MAASRLLRYGHYLPYHPRVTVREPHVRGPPSTTSRGTKHTMQENYISKPAAVAIALWVAVAVFMASGWVIAAVWGDKGWRWAALMAMTGCTISALATVMHIRLYALRTLGLIRAAHGLDPVPAEGRRLEAVREL